MKKTFSSKRPPFELNRWGLDTPTFDEKVSFDFLPPLPQKVNVLPPVILEENDRRPETVTERSFPVQKTVQRSSEKNRQHRETEQNSSPKNRSWLSIFKRLFSSRRFIGPAASLAFHLILFGILAAIVIRIHVGTLGNSIEAGFSPEMNDLMVTDFVGSSLESESAVEAIEQLKSEDVPQIRWNETSTLSDSVLESIQSGQELAHVSETPMHQIEKAETGGGGLPIFTQKGTMAGRTEFNRKKGLPGREGDTTKESEDAVERGLLWLANHQLPDGGWAFDLSARDRSGQIGACQGRCSNTRQSSGQHDPYTASNNLHPSRAAATAIALLPFLGAGYTHAQENPYQKVVAAGLDFLKYQAVISDAGTDYRSQWLGQGMYIQGIVTLAFCEAYEMTGDQSLLPYAQGGIQFIEAAQREDGGWRYHTPTESLDYYKDAHGDTTVTGWQVMALKSAISAELNVHPSTMYRISGFLDSVQTEEGSQYRYLPTTTESEDKLHATSAIGLMIRLNLGWQPEHPSFRRGTEFLIRWLHDADRLWKRAKKGQQIVGKQPLFDSKNVLIYNLYFTYFAMLVLHMSDSPDWHREFADVRTFLIETQSRGKPADAVLGHTEAGSWLFSDLYLNDAGRLLYTSLALLTLETPYRYLPMYQREK